MPRLYFVQWLRVFLIALVVAHHAGQPYGPTGGAWPVHDQPTAVWLTPFFGLNAAYFMGFFFLIAGYFSPGSFDRKGAGKFVSDRLIRLGIPLLVVVLFVFGPLIYLSGDRDVSFLSFFFSTYIGQWHVEMGPLWFLAQLLVYDLLYALWRVGLARQGRSDDWKPSPPGDRAILVYALALAIAGALVRVFYPQDVWVRILWVIPAELAHMPQYVSLFVIGLLAGRGEWFIRIPSAIGSRWFVVGAAAFVAGIGLFFVRDRLPEGINFGVVWGFFEGFVCVGMILGLTVFFRRWLNQAEPLLA